MAMMIKSVVAGTLIALAAGETQGAECSAWFMVDRNAGVVQIHAYCSCPDAGGVEYRLETTSAGPAGTSTSRQSGSAELVAGTPSRLATVTLRGESAGYYDVILDVFRDGSRVARAREAAGKKAL
jgi:hypothetical protein